MRIFELPWWAYIIMAILMFGLCMLLNYIVHKINAARMEEKYAQFLRKNPDCQSIQTQPSMKIEAPKKTNKDHEQKRISLVFSKDQVLKKFHRDKKENVELVATVVKKPATIVSATRVNNTNNIHNVYKSIQKLDETCKKEGDIGVSNEKDQISKEKISGNVETQQRDQLPNEMDNNQGEIGQTCEKGPSPEDMKNEEEIGEKERDDENDDNVATRFGEIASSPLVKSVRTENLRGCVSDNTLAARIDTVECKVDK